MNREIKFRGKRVDNGEWIYGYLVNKNYISEEGMKLDYSDDLGWYECGNIDEVVPETVGQYTGLKDKNGKEIYPGNIFGKLGGDTNRPNEYEYHGIVYFDNDLSAFCVKKSNGGWEYLWKYLEEDKFSEIIGNRYENPELLKGE